MGLFFDQYARDIIRYYDLQKKSENEFGSRPCPNCGGVDRFWINNHNGMLSHHCRKGCDFVERTKAMRKDGVLPSDYKTEQIPYHLRKQIPLMGGAYLDGDNVIIPLTDVSSGELRGKQVIYPNSRKLFEKGLKKDNAGCFIGEKSSILYVCEGWATAVAVHMATGEQALFALDAKTLVKTVRRLQHSRIIIAGDNDLKLAEALPASLHLRDRRSPDRRVQRLAPRDDLRERKPREHPPAAAVAAWQAIDVK